MAAAKQIDVVIVGSGINALVAAALMARRGKSVQVLERNDRIGGCIRSDQITEPGFIHDVLAATWVLFVTSPAFGELGEDLARHGLEFCHSEFATGVLRSDGSALVLSQDRAANIARFDAVQAGEGAAHRGQVEHVENNADLLFGLLGGKLASRSTATLIGKSAWRKGMRDLRAMAGDAMISSRGWLETQFQNDLVRALFAPWCLHAGLGPENAFAGEMTKIIAFALEAAGAPVVKGGGQNALAAFRGLIEEHGGQIETSADVERVLVANGRAAGVRLADGREFKASSVFCSVAPGQLYERLLSAEEAAEKRDQARRFRHGKGNFQLHYALDAPPDWGDAELGKVALLHLSDGIDAVSRAVNEAERGLLPAEATICVGQPHVLDPSRCPDGKAVLWLQMPEAPRHIRGDALGEISVNAEGSWSEEIREAYADRIEERLRRHTRNFDAIKLGRTALSPADLEELNVNLVGGDPYGGKATIDQFFLWRPFSDSVNHQTPIGGLYHIGASTHPGPGLGGGSGFLAAQEI